MARPHPEGEVPSWSAARADAPLGSRAAETGCNAWGLGAGAVGWCGMLQNRNIRHTVKICETRWTILWLCYYLICLLFVPPKPPNATDISAAEESSSSEVGSAAQDIEAQIKTREDQVERSPSSSCLFLAFLGIFWMSWRFLSSFSAYLTRSCSRISCHPCTRRLLANLRICTIALDAWKPLVSFDRCGNAMIMP